MRWVVWGALWERGVVEVQGGSGGGGVVRGSVRLWWGWGGESGGQWGSEGVLKELRGFKGGILGAL